MSFRLDLCTIPEQRGEAGAVSSWSGASTTVVTITGSYTGESDAIYTIYVITAGTVGSAAVAIGWFTDDGEAGRIDFAASYAGTTKYINRGLYVALSTSATLAVGDSCTFTAYAIRRHRDDARFISAQPSGGGTAIFPGSIARVPLDIANRNFDGRIRVLPSVIQRNPSIEIQPIGSSEKSALDLIESERHEVSVGENYDLDTVFLLRGGGIHPLVGAPLDYTRNDVLQPYRDPKTGLWRQAAAHELPIEAGLVGRACVISTLACNNLDARFHAINASSSPTAGWTNAAGSPSYSFDTNVRGTLDPDGGWDPGALAGTLRVEMGAGGAIRSNTRPSIISGNRYCSRVVFKGRGKVRVAIWDDPAGLPTEIAGQDVTLDGTDDFQDIVLVGDAVSSTSMELRITAAEQSIIWISWKAQTLGFVAGGPVETLGSTATTAAARFKLQRFTLPQNGTFSCWFKFPNGDYNNTGLPLPIFEETSAGNFLIRYDPINTRLRFGFTSGTIMNLNLSGRLAHDTWHHLVATWDRSSSTSGEVQMALYIRDEAGTLQSTSNDLAWSQPPSVATAVYEIGYSAASHRALRDWLFQEIRIDRRPWTAVEVLDQWERGIKDEWTNHASEFNGRGYRIRSDVRWLGGDRVNPQLWLANLQLRQSSTHGDSLSVPK